MITTFILASLAVAVLAGHKKASGVGAVKKAKRRIYQELADAQERGLDFTMNADQLTDEDVAQLKYLADEYGWKQSAASVRAGKTFSEAYFNNLKKAYMAISGIGTTRLPYRESVVYNENGDEIIRYRNYGTPYEKMHYALAWYSENADAKVVSDTESFAYEQTVYAIATGTKFVWKGKKKGGVFVYRGLLEELFGTGEGKYNAAESHNEERKKRISYLGSKEKGAVTPARFVESVISDAPGHTDPEYSEVVSGVHQALRDIQSVGQARQIIMDDYLAAHTNEEEDPYAIFDRPYLFDVPGDDATRVNLDDMPF